MFALPLILCITFALLGLLLALLGWRGRRIDDHPWCRRCRFDLFGLPVESLRCPECGAVLEVRGAVRHGHRRRRPVVLGAGVLVLALIATWIILLFTGVLATVNWNQYKPTWWLAIEAGSTDPFTFPPALNELRSRMEQGELSEERTEALARIGINSMQTAFADGVPAEWDQFILRAWRLHHLSDEIKLRYAENCIQTALALEPAELDDRPAAALSGSISLSRATGANGWYRMRVLEVTVDGNPIPVPDLPEQHIPGMQVRLGASSVLLADPFALSREVMHDIKATVEWRLNIGYGGFTQEDFRTGRSTGIRWQSQYSFSRVDPNRRVVCFVSDAASGAALADSIKVDLFGIRESEGGPARLAGYFTVQSPPVDLDARMRVTAGGTVLIDRTDLSGSTDSMLTVKSFAMPLPPGDFSTVDVLLTPSLYQRLPQSSADSRLRLWYAPLRISDISVTWFDDLDDVRLPAHVRDLISRMR